MILGHDNHGIPKLSKDLQTSAREPQLSFERLISIGNTADRHNLWLPFPRSQLCSKQLRGVFFDKNSGLEVQACGETEILMIRTCVTIDASVLTASIRIDTGFEADIRAVIEGDQ